MIEKPKTLILAVDDNPQNLQLLGSILQSEDYEVAMAMNGREALDYLAEELPDLILLDVMMPELDGFQVCSEFKKKQKNSNVPVIFLTAKNEVDDIVKGFDFSIIVLPFPGISESFQPLFSPVLDQTGSSLL